MNTSHPSQHPLKQHSSNTPFEISEYIKKNFEGGFHSEIKQVKEPNGQTSYLVNLNQDDIAYHLKFDAKGKIVKNEVQSFLDEDDDDFDNE